MLIFQDLKRKQALFAKDGVPASMWKVLLSDGTSAIMLYRGMRWCAQKKLLPFAYMFQYCNKLLNSCMIGIRAEFGAGFVILHPMGIVINSAVQGGENITLESGVVIGNNRGHSPKLESNIFVGSGAKIIGGVTINSHVKVGANAVVTKDVESNVIVVGIPAKPLRTFSVEDEE